MTTESEKLALHFKYCSFIFTMIIIGIATDRWTAQKDFTAYLSNAATMTSLLLGLVAIFYSFISNDSLSKSLGSITTVSSEVKETKEQISQYLNLTKEATSASVANSNQLQNVSKDVSSAIDSLSSTLKEITEQNKSLQTIVSGVPNRLDQFEINVTKALEEKPVLPRTSQTNSLVTVEFVNQFLARSSLTHNLFTYACVVAKNKNKALDIDKICNSIEVNTPSNFGGFLNCMHATMLMTTKYSSITKTIEIIHLNSSLTERTRKYFTDYISEAEGMPQSKKTEWLAKLTKLDNLYS